LNSLLAQTYSGWVLLVRDDGSSDNTVGILKRYSLSYPEKVIIHPSSGRHLGIKRSFSLLMEVALERGAYYVALADQDDVWLPNKLEIQVRLLEEIGSDPGIAYTDLVLVDSRLRVLASSLWKSRALLPELGSDYRRVLFQNVATGCATMVNRSLIELALPIPEEAVMHDWWLLLVGSFLGRVSYSWTPTVLYRQHGDNAWGVSDFRLRTLLSRGVTYRERLNSAVRQAKIFLERFRKRLTAEQVEILERFSNLERMDPISRRLFLLSKGILKHGIVRNIGLLLLV